MRAGGLAAAVLAAWAPGAARADSPLLLDRPDLHAHFWISYGLALTTTELLEGPQPDWGPQLGTGPALGIATAGVAALGLLKEVALDTAIDGDDLIADAAGLLANVALQLLVDF